MRTAITAFVVVALSGVAWSGPADDAAQIYELGQHAYDAKDYTEAINEWTSSYALSGAGGLLFNIAQAYRLRDQRGDCARALESYRLFIKLVPTSPQRRLAEGFIASLATCPDAEAPVPNAPPVRVALTAGPVHPGRLERRVGIATGSVGALLVVGGIYFGHHAYSLSRSVSEACMTSCEWSTESSTDSSAHRDASVGWALDGVGAAALLGGAALYYLGVRDGEIQLTPLASTAVERGAMLSWNGSW
jgi:hypothetical protein